MDLDITFCDNNNCNNLECQRNVKHILENKHINNPYLWYSKFTDCKYYNIKDKGEVFNENNKRS